MKTFCWASLCWFSPGLSWVVGDAEELPFDDDQFDIYTIAFGIRNVTHMDQVTGSVSPHITTRRGRIASVLWNVFIQSSECCDSQSFVISFLLLNKYGHLFLGSSGGPAGSEARWQIHVLRVQQSDKSCVGKVSRCGFVAHVVKRAYLSSGVAKILYRDSLTEIVKIENTLYENLTNLIC